MLSKITIYLKNLFLKVKVRKLMILDHKINLHQEKTKYFNESPHLIYNKEIISQIYARLNWNG